VKKIAKEVAEKTGGDVLTASAVKECKGTRNRLLPPNKRTEGAYRLACETLPEESKPKLPKIQTKRRNVDLLNPRD
jgi:hypothetical protein